MSRIGNRRIMRALGAVLGIEDVKQAPTELDTSTLKAVASLDPGMMGMGQVQLVAQASVAGLTGASWLAIGPATFSPAPAALNTSLSTIRANGEIECVILGLRIEVGFTEPIVAVNNLIEIREFRQAAGNTTSVLRCSSFRGGLQTDQYQDRYIWSYPMWQHARMRTQGEAATLVDGGNPIMAASPIYVPPGSVWGLEVQYWQDDMANLIAFPAGTTVDVHGFVVTCPKGMRPPGM